MKIIFQVDSDGVLMKQKHGIGNIYTPGWLMRLFVLAMGIIVAGMHAYMLRSTGGATDFPLFFFGFILLIDAWLLWYSIIFTTQTRVFVTADGIEMQRGGSHLFTPWENISHFGIKGGGKSQQRGIYLYHKVEPEVTGLAEKLFYGWATDFIPIGQVINLPTNWGFFRHDINIEGLAETEFGQDVAYHAPHLLGSFGGYEQEKSKLGDLSYRSSDSSYVVGADTRSIRKEKRD
jgi:hypothetical protein